MSSVESCVSDDGNSFVEAVSKALAENNWAIHRTEGESVIGFTVRLGDDLFPIELKCYDETRDVCGRVIYVPEVPYAFRRRAVKFAHMANSTRSNGCVRVDDDGWISYSNSLSLWGVSVTPPVIERFVLTLVKQATQIICGLRALLHGEKPDQAACVV